MTWMAGGDRRTWIFFAVAIGALALRDNLAPEPGVYSIVQIVHISNQF